ncbi:MAG TPA: LuxR family transcriptional regulator [Enteractinococcus sp.]
MSYPPEELKLVDLDAEREILSEAARKAVARRAGSTLYRGDGVRQTMVVLLAGEEMAAHESPQEGFVHVMEGSVRLNGANRSWEIGSGQLLPVPPEKHSVTALEDSVLTLTVLRQSVINR